MNAVEVLTTLHSNIKTWVCRARRRFSLCLTWKQWAFFATIVTPDSTPTRRASDCHV